MSEAATTIRLAEARDAQRILEIYGPLVSETVISFEAQPPSLSEVRERIERTLTALPWLSLVRDGRVLGYAYASPHRTRQAYAWSVEVSAYLDASARGQGLGRALYGVLLALLRDQGYVNAFAGIGLPNAASVGLHEALGFERVATYRDVGYKRGAWHDVGWWQLGLRSPPQRPEPTLPLADVLSALPQSL